MGTSTEEGHTRKSGNSCNESFGLLRCVLGRSCPFWTRSQGATLMRSSKICQAKLLKESSSPPVVLDSLSAWAPFSQLIPKCQMFCRTGLISPHILWDYVWEVFTSCFHWSSVLKLSAKPWRKVWALSTNTSWKASATVITWQKWSREHLCKKLLSLRFSPITWTDFFFQWKGTNHFCLEKMAEGITEYILTKISSSNENYNPPL